MEFDRFTFALLSTPDPAPALGDRRTAELMDAHLNHLATLHAAGRLIAAGPLRDTAGRLRGIAILRAGESLAADPSIAGGLFALTEMEWNAPAGAIGHAPVPFPHSLAEASA